MWKAQWLHNFDRFNPGVYHVYENPGRLTLHNMLIGSPYTLNKAIMLRLGLGVGEGLRYLAKHGVIHGQLDTSNCIIDTSWTVNEFFETFQFMYRLVLKISKMSHCLHTQNVPLKPDCHWSWTMLYCNIGQVTLKWFHWITVRVWAVLFVFLQVKLANWSQMSVYRAEKMFEAGRITKARIRSIQNEELIKRLLFVHPNILRGTVPRSQIDHVHDFYSLGLVLGQIFTREAPFSEVGSVVGWNKTLVSILDGNRFSFWSQWEPATAASHWPAKRCSIGHKMSRGAAKSLVSNILSHKKFLVWVCCTQWSRII